VCQAERSEEFPSEPINDNVYGVLSARRCFDRLGMTEYNNNAIIKTKRYMLKVENLHAKVGDKEILKGINLEVKAGEVHAIMGPNGSGKSTLASVLAGNEKFTVTEGKVEFEGENLLDLPIEERSRKGLFLGFQYPVEIPGVSMANFMKIAVNEQRKYRGLEPLTAAEYLKMMKEKSAIVELDSKLTSRAVNEGFSGGEKKKNEIFQMAMLDPKLAILDETDSGLDIDALRIVATGVTRLKREDNATVVITHYQRLLDYIVPDYVHVLYKGRIIYTGDKSLALKLEKEGYDWLINDYKEE
jgi:Fe-S cluster assembly ATP-binding protein